MIKIDKEIFHRTFNISVLKGKTFNGYSDIRFSKLADYLSDFSNRIDMLRKHTDDYNSDIAVENFGMYIKKHFRINKGTMSVSPEGGFYPVSEEDDGTYSLYGILKGLRTFDDSVNHTIDEWISTFGVDIRELADFYEYADFFEKYILTPGVSIPFIPYKNIFNHEFFKVLIIDILDCPDDYDAKIKRIAKIFDTVEDYMGYADENINKKFEPYINFVSPDLFNIYFDILRFRNKDVRFSTAMINAYKQSAYRGCKFDVEKFNETIKHFRVNNKKARKSLYSIRNNRNIMKSEILAPTIIYAADNVTTSKVYDMMETDPEFFNSLIASINSSLKNVEIADINAQYVSYFQYFKELQSQIDVGFREDPEEAEAVLIKSLNNISPKIREKYEKGLLVLSIIINGINQRNPNVTFDVHKLKPEIAVMFIMADLHQ